MGTTDDRSADDVVVVIPTYDEAQNIGAMIAAVRDHGYRVLVVDDGSPDGTGSIVDAVAKSDNRVECLHRKAKGGLGPAYAAGFAHVLAGDASTICQMDADFSHDPGSIPMLVKAIADGADLAIGSRYVEGGSAPDWPLPRRLISAAGNIYARAMLGGAIRDMTGGFRAWSRVGLRAADPGSSQASGYAFQVETAWRASRAGCLVVERPIVFRERVAGNSKMGLSIVLEAALLVTTWGLRRLTGRLR